MTLVRLLVVDDHALFRRGLVSLLSDLKGVQVVGEAGNGEEALAEVARCAPDVVLLDVNMPTMGGVETVEALRRQKFEGAILMLTVSKQEDDLLGAIRAGADGYLLKNVEPDELRRAITEVAAGRGVLSPEVTRQVMRAASMPYTRGPGEDLSRREREVLEALGKGLTTAQIAAELFISDNTVKTHVRHILEKLDAANRTEAVRKAVQLGLIREDL